MDCVACDNLEAVIKEISKLEQLPHDQFVFRGQKSIEFLLSPNAYRGIAKNPDDGVINDVYLDVDYHLDEARELYRLFKAKKKSFKKKFNIYINLQHIGFKTKLLDFTFSPWIALLFACIDWECPSNSEDLYKHDGVIDVVDISKMQQMNLMNFDESNNLTFESFFLEDETSIIVGTDKVKAKNLNDFVFIKPDPNSSTRIKNQQGCFILFPKYGEMIFELPEKFISKKIIIKENIKRDAVKYLKDEYNIDRHFVKQIGNVNYKSNKK